MRNVVHSVFGLVIMLSICNNVKGQISSTNPYCTVAYTSGQCNQPNASNNSNNFINDFINDFNTCGANNNIVNNNSGCNGNPNNYIYYATTYTLIVSPNQVITCNLRSGITYGQGFGIFIDWNQNNQFDLPGEEVAYTTAVPTAFTWTTLTFQIPNGQAAGLYRMRVRCSYATANPPPCGSQTFGETEDYDLVVTSNPAGGILTATASISNGTLCTGQTLSLSVSTNSSSTPAVTWAGPGSFTSNIQTPVVTNVNTSNSGVYTVTLPNGGCPVVSTVTLVVAPSPNFTITIPTQSICQGGVFNTNVATATSTTQLAFQWSSSAPGLIFNPQLPGTTIQPSLLPVGTPSATYVYSLVVTPTVNSCPEVHTMTLSLFNPPTPTLTMPPPFCDTHAAIQLSATPGGGTWSANPAVSSNGLFNPQAATIGTNSVTYSITSWTCTASNSASFIVSRYHSPALTTALSMICVQDPVFNLMTIVQNTITGQWTGVHVNGNSQFNPSGLATGNYSLTYHTTSLPIASVCPASTVLVVSVFNPPTPIINTITPVCNTSGTITLVASPVNGVWSGNSGVSPSGIQTPSLNQIGVNTVTYTAGQGTCVASSARSFTVSQFNTAALTGSISPLCVSNNPVSLMTIVQNTNGAWSGPSVNNNTFTPSNLPTNTYSLVYTTTSTPNPIQCPDRRVLVVSVLNPATPVIKHVGPYCNTSAPVQLSVSPSTGSWSPSAFLTAGGLYTPSLTSIGNNQVQYVIGTSTCNAKQTITINTELFIPATILSGLPDLCTNTPPTSLTYITANNLGSWYGPGIVGATFNPTLTGGGTFIVSYNTASSPSGLCPDQGTLAVHVYSLAPPYINFVGPFCNKSTPVQLQVTPLGGFFTSGTPGLISTSGLFNPAAGVIGNNLITYSVTVGPCVGYSRLNITVEAFVSADFDNNARSAFCKNEAPFNLNSIVQYQGGTWSGTGVIGNMFYPSQANVGENNILVYQTHSPSALLCPDTSAIRIKIKDIPNVSAVANMESGCAPLEVVLNTPSINNGKGLWTFGDGTTENGLTSTHTYKQPGNYTIQFDYSDQEVGGCTAQFVFNKPVSVYGVPKADFIISSDEVTISNPEVSLTNISSPLNNNSYVWTIQGMNQVFDLDPQITFPQAGNYNITLQAISVHGCKSEVSKSVEVKNDFNIYIPNSFSPNADGINDLFKPVFSPFGLDEKTYDMEVFDRWGHSVFHTKDFTKGWDGSTQNKGDLPVKQDTYLYKIRYKDLEGRIYEKMGSLTLLPH